ncbi:MAG: LacI family DNA-binding transcriptional regulator [bacterium]|nr:LacI family DNA-binding transcriptional regulator [bacterium]
MKEAVSIRDVATAARVSPATVSRALNSELAHLVNPATRARILRVVAARNYQPNPFARALGGGSSKSFALVFPPTTHFIESAYDTHVIVHTVAAVHDIGYDLKVHFLGDDDAGKTTDALLRQLAVDGLILAGVPRACRLVLPPVPAASPVVFLNSDAPPGAGSVDADNLDAGRQAAAHLLQHGHTALGMLCGRRDSRNAIDRTHGYRRHLRACGVRLQPHWFAHCDYGIREGHAAAGALLARTPRPTALFCASDEIALGVLQACHELHLRCPHDLSLIGFDNALAVQHTTPALTTFEQPIADMTRAAVAMLQESIRTHTPATHVLCPVRLIERDSVRRLRAAARHAARPTVPVP